MKKLTCIVMSIFLAAILLTSCGGGESPFDKNKTLSVLGKKSDMEKSYMVKLFDLYEEETGNTLDLVKVEDSLFETIATDYFSKGYVPDIFLHFHNADLNRFDIQENFRFLNGESWADDLTDSARAYCTDGSGNLLGLPFWESSVSGCYYNKTLLESLGFKPAATQAEFDTLCESLKELGYTPICWPAKGCSWMYQFGLDPVFADHPETLEKLNAGEIDYKDIPEFEKMVTWVKESAEKGWFGEDFLDVGWDEIGGKMSSGEAAMTFIWDTWFYTDFKAGKYGVEDFGVMPIFVNTVEGGTFEGGNLNMMMVNKNSAKCEDALDFLAFCADPKVYNECFEGIATLSCFKGMTTNIESQMVKDARASIAKKERVSTAATRVVGYSADDMASAFSELFQKKKSVKELIDEMDSLRHAEIEKYFQK